MECRKITWRPYKQLDIQTQRCKEGRADQQQTDTLLMILTVLLVPCAAGTIYNMYSHNERSIRRLLQKYVEQMHVQYSCLGQHDFIKWPHGFWAFVKEHLRHSASEIKWARTAEDTDDDDRLNKKKQYRNKKK